MYLIGHRIDLKENLKNMQIIHIFSKWIFENTYRILLGKTNKAKTIRWVERDIGLYMYTVYKKC